MESIQREMKGLMEEVDGILYYDTEKLQKSIEKEMTEKGLKEGMEQGIEQGFYQAKIDTAKKLLSYGDSLEKIREVTGLSIEEIEKIN